MIKMFDEDEARKRQEAEDEDDGDFSDMLSEMRILLPGAQMLTAFLIILPFNGGFARIVQSEKLVFLATFVLSLTSLVLLSAPAVQHRIMRPLKDRARFKHVATKLMVTGSCTLAVALVLGTELVISEVFGQQVGLITAGSVALLILGIWWWMPRYLKKHAGV
ncbi:MAG: DUF6328 family protein [Duganella sp.]